MRGHQPWQAWHQPARHDAGTGAERERVMVARAERRERVFEAVEMPADCLEQAAALDSQRHAARPALEQAPLQAFLELAHLVAERTDGQVRLRRRARQVALPGDQHELLQQAERQSSHLEYSSSLACEYIAFWRTGRG